MSDDMKLESTMERKPFDIMFANEVADIVTDLVADALNLDCVQGVVLCIEDELRAADADEEAVYTEVCRCLAAVITREFVIPVLDDRGIMDRLVEARPDLGREGAEDVVFTCAAYLVPEGVRMIIAEEDE